jgi:hypothetical protein
MLALEDGLERVAGLGDLREIDPWHGFGVGSCSRGGPAATAQVVANLLGLVGLDGAGVGLLFSDADCRKSIQNRFALYFQFTRQIVDSNFAHPSLFASLRP